MILSLSAPGKYFQGKNLLIDIYARVGFLGTKFAILTDDIVFKIVSEKITKSFTEADGKYVFVKFNGESTTEEANRVAKKVLENRCDVIMGIGGGKTLDTAKLVSNNLSLPLVIVPTVASSDAPCSAMSVIYDTDGTFIISARMKKNPDIVLVDTSIIAEAPVRTLIAGIGDAFATYYEARACKQSGAKNFSGGVASEAGYSIAKLCNDLLLEFGKKAKQDVENKQWSEALEKVVEANIYLSGVGFENNGCAIAHAMYNGLTAVLKPFPVLHGEAVAFGTIVQLIAEGLFETGKDEFNRVVDFYKEIGLPLTFKGMGIGELEDEKLRLIAEATCTKSKNAINMPFAVTPDIIYKSIKKTLNLFQ